MGIQSNSKYQWRMFQTRVLGPVYGEMISERMGHWLFFNIWPFKNKIPNVQQQTDTECRESAGKRSPEAGYPLALVCGLTVAQLRLGVGANYLESFGGKQPFLFLSSGALIQQGGNKHGEIEAHWFHKIDHMQSTGEKRKGLSRTGNCIYRPACLPGPGGGQEHLAPACEIQCKIDHFTTREPTAESSGIFSAPYHCRVRVPL